MAQVLMFLRGLAFFLYGMRVMGEGLERASGGRLERLLGRLCSSTWKGILCGAVVTALIQSSSATTVMVVGFVNSGMMTLSSAVGIIMVANLGTTFTAWLLSLSGMEGGAIWLEFLKPSFFSPIIAFLGILFLLQKRNASLKDVGAVFLGFSVLLGGMETMSTAAAPLAESDFFRGMTAWFANPIIGLVFGILMTALLQSSSAAVGVLQALTVTGGFTYAMAIPIVMGQNIGTCVTALLSGIGAQVNAKRAALVHLYFNVIGSAALMVLFAVLRGVIGRGFGGETADRASIAAIHTIFNLLSVVILFPFARFLEKLAIRSVPDRQKGKGEATEKETGEDENADGDRTAFRLLDARFFRSPSFAFSMGRLVYRRMMTLAFENLRRVSGALKEHRSLETESEAERGEAVIDAYENDLGTYLLRLSAYPLPADEAGMLGNMLSGIHDVERIGDHAFSLNREGAALERTGKDLSEDARKELILFLGAVEEIGTLTCAAYGGESVQSAEAIEPLRVVIDQMRETLMARHIARLRRGVCDVENSGIWTSILTDGTRVAAHCSNLALLALQEKRKNALPHGYMQTVRFENPEGFMRQYAAFHEKYRV